MRRETTFNPFTQSRDAGTNMVTIDTFKARVQYTIFKLAQT